MYTQGENKINEKKKYIYLSIQEIIIITNEEIIRVVLSLRLRSATVIWSIIFTSPPRHSLDSETKIQVQIKHFQYKFATLTKIWKIYYIYVYI